MPKICIFNDPHYSRTQPTCRTEKYYRECLQELDNCIQVAKKVGAHAVACTGDWFHRKGKTRFSEVNDILTKTSSWRAIGLEVLSILGNHDIAGHDLSSMSKRAVGAMVHSGQVRLLDKAPYFFENDSGSIYVTGTSYFHGCDSSDEARIRMYGANRKVGSDIHIHLCHGTLINKGSFFDDFTTAPELIDLLAAHGKCPDVIVCGHLHFSEGVRAYDHPKVAGKKVLVCRVGSLGRVSRDDMDRVPVCLALATKGTEVKYREYPVGVEASRASSDPVQDPEANYDRIREFVSILREESDEWSSRDVRGVVKEVVRKLGYGDLVLERALSAVEGRELVGLED